MRSGDDYTAALRDDRAVYLDGKRVITAEAVTVRFAPAGEQP
jgi:hypothetical protein